jgi:hypothetical protein
VAKNIPPERSRDGNTASYAERDLVILGSGRDSNHDKWMGPYSGTADRGTTTGLNEAQNSCIRRINCLSTSAKDGSRKVNSKRNLLKICWRSFI